MKKFVLVLLIFLTGQSYANEHEEFLEPIVLGPISMIRGQAAQLNVYHLGNSWCILDMFFTYGQDQFFLDETGAPFVREVRINRDDRSFARKFILTSGIAFSENNFQGKRLRLQGHVIEVAPPLVQFSPPVATSDCQEISVTLEIIDQKTLRTELIITN